MNTILVILVALAGAVIGALFAGRHCRTTERARDQRLAENELTLRQLRQRAEARRASRITAKEIKDVQKQTHDYITNHLTDRGLADYVNSILNSTTDTDSETDTDPDTRS